jgi:hypothetical protein
MEIHVGVPSGYDDNVRSACCTARVEHYHALSGAKFHRCQRCRKDTTDEGAPCPQARGISPANDVEAAFAAILRALDWYAQTPHPTEAQAAARERQAFYMGARFREVVSNVTGDGFIRYEAASRYPEHLENAQGLPSDGKLT